MILEMYGKIERHSSLKKENLDKYRIKELFKELAARALVNVDKNVKTKLNDLKKWKENSKIVLKVYQRNYSMSKMSSTIE